MTDNDGYVHRPDNAGEPPTEQEFQRRDWLLVAALAVAFVVVPATILYLPYAEPIIGALGLTFRDAYLVLPLVPALGLGAVAVWAALGNRKSAGQGG